MKVDTSVEINRPIEEVFAFVADPTTAPKYSSTWVESSLVGTGPMRVGSKVKRVARFIGRRLEMTAEVTEYEPNHKLSGRSVGGPIPGKIEFRFEPTGSGTRVQVRVDAQAEGVFKLADPVLSGVAKHAWDTDLAALKALLEAQVASEVTR
jgi:uncharacterized membrane protein